MDKIRQQKLLIEMVMRQTKYTYEECEEKLKENNNDYISVIKDFYGIKKKEEKKSTINQGIFKEIRCMMDDAGNKFRINQELEKTIQEKQQQQHLQEQLQKQKKERNSKKLDTIDEFSE